MTTSLNQNPLQHDSDARLKMIVRFTFKALKLAAILVLLFFAARFFYFCVIAPEELSKKTTTHIAAGKVEGKSSNDYACGKNGRKICTEYAFEIDGKSHVVTPESFKNVAIGENTTLTKTEIDNSLWPFVQIMIGVCGWALILIYLVGRTTKLYTWAFKNEKE